MYEHEWLVKYITAQQMQDAVTRRALFYALPIVLLQSANAITDLFIDILATLPSPSLKTDFCTLFPQYWETPNYCIIATAVELITSKQTTAVAKAQILQSALGPTV
jgi:hypothetical protein